MKDKEKQIEEMAKDIPYLTLSRRVFASMTEMKNVGWTLSEEDNKLIAETLISNGWIKPDKDSVVLLREELNNIENKCFDNGFDKGAEIGRANASKETAEKIICLIKSFSYDKEFVKIITRIISERLGVEIKE